MENLWKKGIYIDIFRDEVDVCGYDDTIAYGRKMILEKNNEASTERRVFGDDLCNCGFYEDAIHKYTSSLRYAENGSENVKKAYFKRAACFYKLDNHTRGDKDIELAFEACTRTEIPDDILQKRRTCIQFRKVVGEYEEHLTKEMNLDFDPHKDFPCLANVVDLEYNEQLGRHFVANSDIPQHKVILKEECFAVSKIYKKKLCYTCFRGCQNFIPCENCTVAIFCNRECMYGNKTHHLDCGSIFSCYGLVGDTVGSTVCFFSQFTIQTVLNAIVIFGDVKKLMDFVKTTLMEDPDQIPKSIQSDEEKYRVYLKLKKFENEKFKRDRYAQCSYKLAMEIPRIRELFDTLEKQRFLMHLITHHGIVNSTNAFANGLGLSVNNMLSFFNHSCEYNVAIRPVHLSFGVGTERDIKKGEQLCISYITDEQINQPVDVRQEYLRETWGFLCECSKCKNTPLPPATC